MGVSRPGSSSPEAEPAAAGLHSAPGPQVFDELKTSHDNKTQTFLGNMLKFVVRQKLFTQPVHEQNHMWDIPFRKCKLKTDSSQ